MEELIEALKEANKKIQEVNRDLDALLETMGRIQTLPWGSDRDNKNEDSNLEHEQ